jgi:hypothetical protein
MACRRVLSSTPLLVRGSETGGDSGEAGNRHLPTRPYKQEIQIIQGARIGQAGRGASIDAGGSVSEAMSSLGCTLMRTL